MEKSIFCFLAVCLSFQLAHGYCSTDCFKYVAAGVCASLVLWYGYRFLIRPLDIQRVNERYYSAYIYTLSIAYII